MTELISCPFCGQSDWKEIQHESINDARWMRCQKCSACSSWVWLDRYPANQIAKMDKEDFRMMTRADSEKVWNTRPIEDALKAEIDKLRVALEKIAEVGSVEDSGCNSVWGVLSDCKDIARAALEVTK